MQSSDSNKEYCIKLRLVGILERIVRLTLSYRVRYSHSLKTLWASQVSSFNTVLQGKILCPVWSCPKAPIVLSLRISGKQIGLLKLGQDSSESSLTLIHLIVRTEFRFRNQILSATFSGTYLISNTGNSKGILICNYLSYGNQHRGLN